MVDSIKKIIDKWLVRFSEYKEDVLQEVYLALLEKGIDFNDKDIQEVFEIIEKSPKTSMRMSKQEIYAKWGKKKGEAAYVVRRCLQRFFDDERFGKSRTYLRRKDIPSGLMGHAADKKEDNDLFDKTLKKEIKYGNKSNTKKGCKSTRSYRSIGRKLRRNKRSKG